MKSLIHKPLSLITKTRIRGLDAFKGVITVGSSFEHAYECDVECIEHVEAQVEDEALAATLNPSG